MPAVIIQHGSGPPKWSWYVDVATRLNEAGIGALVPDSHAARGIAATTQDQSQLSMANRVFDTFAAFRALHRVPCIDSARIGVTGYGFGGMVSREMVESALADRLGGGQIVKASLPVYPSCQMRWDVSRPTRTRVHYLLAGLDDYTPAHYCLEQIAMQEADGWDVSHTVYPEAHHAFNRKFPVGRFDEVTFQDCGLGRITEDGVFVTDYGDTRHGWGRYVWRHAGTCAKTGVTMGRNPAARADALEFTVQFFRNNL